MNFSSLTSPGSEPHWWIRPNEYCPQFLGEVRPRKGARAAEPNAVADGRGRYGFSEFIGNALSFDAHLELDRTY